MPFDSFLGVDQTGAVRTGGRKAKALPAVVIEMRHGNWAVQPLFLAAFTRSEVRKATTAKNLAMIVDCVLGLPAAMDIDWSIRQLFSEAGRFLLDDDRQFGRDVAEAFFEGIRNGKAIQPRQCESLARANSVFRSRPFQKNIQTGTYRIWKDIADQSEWFGVWPHESGKSKRYDCWMFEGYPSLAWQLLFGVKNRDAKSIQGAFQESGLTKPLCVEDWKVFEKSPDLCDALVLAALGWKLLRNEAEDSSNIFDWKAKDPKLLKEGWILGLGNGTFEERD